MLNRSDQPRILEPEQLVVQRPERIKLPNGVPLSVLNAGDNEVTRIDLLMAGGRWQQKQPLQALFTNRMLREGTRRYDAAQIAEKLDYYGAWLELSSASEYAYVTLYSLNKYLPQTLDILESIVKEPVFPEKELGVIVDNNIQQFLVFQGGLSGAPRIGEGSVRRAASRWTSGAGRGLSAHHSCGATRVL